MNNRIISIVIVSLLVIGGFIGIFVKFSDDVEAPGPTYVSGLITENTTWTVDGNPYIIIDHTTLMKGKTLTIKADTLVKFKDNIKLTIRGTLHVIGNNTHRVIFTNEDPLIGNGINYCVDIDELNGGTANITYARFEHSTHEFGALVLYHEDNPKAQSIMHTEFINNTVGLSRGDDNLLVRNCLFKDNNHGTDDFIGFINDSLFYNNTVGAFSPEYHPKMYNCNFIKNGYGISEGGTHLKYCRIFDNNIGINDEYWDINITYSSIYNNNIGILLPLINSPTIYLKYNNIYNNSQYNLKLRESTDKDVTNNWWGTSNTTIIDQYIYDIYDDIFLGEAIYKPFLTGPVGQKSARLKQGCNLISIPLIQGDEKIDKVLSTISGEYYAAQWYDASDAQDPWKHHHTSKPPYLNDLHKIDHTMAFFIYTNQPGDTVFIYNGQIPTQNQKIPLHQGWNLVGYPSKSDKPRDVALNNLTFNTHVDSIWTYNSATQKWKELGPLDNFEIGCGYWIHAKVECEWEVPL